MNNNLKTEKETWQHQKVKEASENPSKTWKLIKSMLSWTSGGPPIQLSINGNIIRKPVEIANAMNSYFVSKINNIVNSLPQSNQNSSSFLHKLMRNRICEFSLKSVHPDTIDKIISNMKNVKSCGLDEIDSSVIKLARADLVPALTHIVNLSISQRCFPVEWKTAKIVPLHKKNDVMEPKNYRPVALLSIMSKILERAIFQQIVDYMEHNKLFHPSRHGFRAGRSTTTALLEMHDIWIDAFDRNELTATVMLDLSAAFDVVSPTILLKKLTEYGFNNAAIEWVQSYLTGRKQRVFVDGILSEPLSVEIGVPQGSILGPLLYTVFTNDLPEVVHCHENPSPEDQWPPFHLPCIECGSIIAFADDSTFSISRSNPAELKEAIDNKYKHIASYMAMNKLSLNTEKTHLMILTSARQHRVNGDYGIQLDTGSESILPSVNERLLGVHVANNFTWNEHILSMVRSLSLKNNGLQKVCKHANFKSRKMLANGLINSQLIYCVQLYGGTSDYLLNYLQVQQNRAARIVTRLEKCTEVGLLLQQVGWLSVRQLCVYHSLLLVFNTQDQKMPEYFCRKFTKRFPYATRRSKNNFFSMENTPKSETSRTSFFHRSLVLWNGLPDEVKKVTEMEVFKRKSKMRIQHSIEV